jgi:hypothetical protein
MWSLHGFLHGIKWIMFHGHLDFLLKSLLGGRSNTNPEDRGTPNAHNRWFILFYHVWGHARIEFHWNNTRLRARSSMTSHYTWRSVTTLHDFGGVLERPLDILFWALTISWSHFNVWSGLEYASVVLCYERKQSSIQNRISIVPGPTYHTNLVEECYEVGSMNAYFLSSAKEGPFLLSQP